MNTMQRFFKICLFSIFVFAVGFWLWSAPLTGFSQEEGDELAYAPLIYLEATPTPTQTLTPTPSPTPSCIAPDPVGPINADIEDAILDAIQEAREDEDRDRLTRNESIVQAARRHSTDMADNNFVNHQGSNGDYGPDRLAKQCYFIESDQEIIWRGIYEDAEDLVEAWLENEFWERAMMDRSVEEFGIGHAVGLTDPSSNEDPENNGEQVERDYITVSFALEGSIESPTSEADLLPDRQTVKSCLLNLENENGSGILRLHNPSICTDAYYQLLDLDKEGEREE